MPFSIDIHENQFLDEIWNEGKEEGRIQGREEGREEGRIQGRQEALDAVRETLLNLLTLKFGPLPDTAVQRVSETKDIAVLKAWSRSAVSSATLDQALT